MARCGCGSVGATGAAMESTNCIGVSGAGTPLDPFVPALVIDGASDNLLVCGSDGLYARAPQQTEDDASMVITGGVIDGDYGYHVQISEDAGNGLELRADGVYSRANPVIVTATGLFGGPPADPNYIKIVGTLVDTTNIAGHITVPIFPTIAGISTITYSLGDVPLTLTNHSLDVATVGLSGFDVVFQDTAGAGPIVGGTYRINYEVTAWYT